MKKLKVYMLMGLHLAFIVLAVFGGVGVLFWEPLLYFHLPALLWALVVEAMHWPCPLTTWENYLRKRAEMPAYENGFVDHYILTPVFGEDKSKWLELGLTISIVGLNLVIYLYLWEFS